MSMFSELDGTNFLDDHLLEVDADHELERVFLVPEDLFEEDLRFSLIFGQLVRSGSRLLPGDFELEFRR